MLGLSVKHSCLEPIYIAKIFYVCRKHTFKKKCLSGLHEVANLKLLLKYNATIKGFKGSFDSRYRCAVWSSRWSVLVTCGLCHCVKQHSSRRSLRQLLIILVGQRVPCNTRLLALGRTVDSLPLFQSASHNAHYTADVLLPHSLACPGQ